jgi:hypothetical protein
LGQLLPLISLDFVNIEEPFLTRAQDCHARTQGVSELFTTTIASMFDPTSYMDLDGIAGLKKRYLYRLLR